MMIVVMTFVTTNFYIKIFIYFKFIKYIFGSVGGGGFLYISGCF